MEILELRRNEFIPGAGIVPVYSLQDDFVSGNAEACNPAGRGVGEIIWVVKVDNWFLLTVEVASIAPCG